MTRRVAAIDKYDEPLKIEHREKLDTPEDGITVKTEACGICRSDWHGWKGHWPGHPPEGHVLGHEPAGKVIEVGKDVEKFQVGDKVGVPFNIACGHCSNCWNGQSHVCDNSLSLGLGPDLPGAFATEFAIPKADFNAIHLPDGMSSLEMAALGCRYATSYHALAHKADITPGDWLVVHGVGGIGLSAVQIGSALGANVIAVDINDEPLALSETVGAQSLINSSEVMDVPSEINNITNGGAQISVDALGVEETILNSVNSLSTQGQHIQIGMSSTDENNEGIPLPVNDVVGSEIEYIGSKGMPSQRYDEMVNMIQTGKLKPAKVVNKRVNLDEVSDRLRAMDDYQNVGIEVITEFK